MISSVTPKPRSPHESTPWIPDLGDGTFKNPVLYADYSDPDVIRVGEDFYLTASSFTSVPGLPILHSRDLVNWTIINHALPTLVPTAHYSEPRHGQGVWAPSFRYHDGKFWIYYPDPDFGIYVVTANDPADAWSAPVLVKGGKGLIDPCPLWDDDGRVYLIHGWAKSRAGINNRLTLHELSRDGMNVADEGKVVVDANTIPGWHTLEGPKLYKRGGYYYIFAPAGGVATGWQGVFRAKSIHGPYEHRIVLDQGSSEVNGPHQGAWVETAAGESWFFHFQDCGAYGRITHLQPMVWRSDWPVIGADHDGDGKGEPVSLCRKPAVDVSSSCAGPLCSDDFVSGKLGQIWQWQANPRSEWFSFPLNPPRLRLHAHRAPENFWGVPQLLLQKAAAPEFAMTTRVRFSPAGAEEKAGLVVFGYDYAWIGFVQSKDGLFLVQRVRKDAKTNGAEKENARLKVASGNFFLRVSVRKGFHCEFSYSEEGQLFTSFGEEFVARPGHWVGAKVGIFAAGTSDAPSANGASAVGFADFFGVTVS